MGVKVDGTFLPFWLGVLVLWVEVELPEFGAGRLAMAAEENSVVAGENRDCRFSNMMRQY